MDTALIEEIVRVFLETFESHIEYANICGKSEATGHEDRYDVIFRNCGSYSYRKFSNDFKKFLNKLANDTNNTVSPSSTWKGSLYTWSPSYSLKIDDLRFEFGRRYFSGQKYLEDVSTLFYFTTNNKHFVEDVCNHILRTRDMKIKVKNEYE